jgi:6-phosphogluconolactonase
MGESFPLLAEPGTRAFRYHSGFLAVNGEDRTVRLTDGDVGGAGRLIAFVGSYSNPSNPDAGGIDVFEISRDGQALTALSRVSEPKEAGYLVYAPTMRTLYAVDERKSDGRGPVQPAARVHAFAVDQRDGRLSWLNSRLAPGPRPTFLSVNEYQRVLVSANHGDFEHVERVVRTPEGKWTVEYVYDDSTVLLYDLEQGGHIGELRDVKVLAGHGKDPNFSPQAGGHAQASAHAHCAVFDPSGRYVLVCDKGTDQILVYAPGSALQLVSTYRFPVTTGPRHIAFDSSSSIAFVTCEFASNLASFAFDAACGELSILDQVRTTEPSYDGVNEPAEVRVHPSGRFVYVNNRGEDSIAWFRIDNTGKLTRLGHVSIARSIHPGLAARSFALDPTGSFMLVADRPANLVRSYSVDGATGELAPLAEVPVLEPAFVSFAELSG